MRPLEPRCIRCAHLSRQDETARSADAAGRPCRVCSRHTALTRFYAPYRYEGVARALLYRLKYGRALGGATLLTDAIWEGLLREGIRIAADVLMVPVPLSRRRQRCRGFNQSEVIARILARSIGVTVAAGILKKTRDTPPQMSLPRSARLQNVAGAFAVSDGVSLLGRTVVIVDDVRTTGATLEAAAAALRAAGAVEVWALAVAQTG